MHPDFDLSSQIRRFEDQYARNPGSLIFARLADLHRKAGSPRRALEVLDEGLERHPEYLSAHIVRARTLQALDRSEEAEASYHRVLALDRQNLVALRALAELARERGDLSEARERYERMLEVDPRNDRARARLGELRASGTPSGPVQATEPGPGGRVEPAEDREELADEVRRIVADVRERFGVRGEDEAEEPDPPGAPEAK
ncbi:MAG: tetratricopeptide repeat protein, partial [Gemmatimonadota bacterium]